MGNLRNELLTAQDQLKTLDAQMAKDREKLLKLREDKRILLDKVPRVLSIPLLEHPVTALPKRDESVYCMSNVA